MKTLDLRIIAEHELTAYLGVAIVENKGTLLRPAFVIFIKGSYVEDGNGNTRYFRTQQALDSFLNKYKLITESITD